MYIYIPCMYKKKKHVYNMYWYIQHVHMYIYIIPWAYICNTSSISICLSNLPIYLHNKYSYRPKLILSCDSNWFRFMCFSLNKCVVNVRKDTWILWAHNPSKVFLLLHSVPTWWASECWQVLAIFDNFAFVKSFCMHWVKSWGCTS